MEKKSNKIENQNQEILKRILICIYILIFLVSLNLVFTLNNQTDSNNQTVESGYDISSFKVITAKSLKNELNTNKKTVLLIGKSDCVYTEKLIPTLKKAQDTYGYKTLYLDFTALSEEDKTRILEYDDETKVLEQNYGSTPMVIVFKEKKMEDVWIGYESYDKFSSFLEGLGFEK